MEKFLVTNLLRTRSEALICYKVFFFNRKVLFVVLLASQLLGFRCLRWSILYFFDVDE